VQPYQDSGSMTLTIRRRKVMKCEVSKACNADRHGGIQAGDRGQHHLQDALSAHPVTPVIRRGEIGDVHMKMYAQ
jgi:hypothetical protein